MNMKDRKRYSREFKLEAVRRCEESGKPIAEIARELDVSLNLLYRWRDAIVKEGKNAFAGSGKKEADELAALRRENARLREERDILKKSLVYFAKDQQNDTDSSKSSERSSE